MIDGKLDMIFLELNICDLSPNSQFDTIIDGIFCESNSIFLEDRRVGGDNYRGFERDKKYNMDTISSNPLT